MQNFTNDFNSKTNKFISTRTIFPTFCPSPPYRTLNSYNKFNNTQNEISLTEKNEITINIQPFSNLTSNLNEMQRLYINWSLDPGYNRSLNQFEISSGLHDWALWRTRLNENLIVTSFFNTPLILNQQNKSFILSKDELNDDINQSNSENLFKIDPQTARFIYFLEYNRSNNESEPDYKNNESMNNRRNHVPSLDPESYMFYGLPRVQLNNLINEHFTKKLDKIIHFNTATIPLNKPYDAKESNVSCKEFSTLNNKDVKKAQVSKNIRLKSEDNEINENKTRNSIEPIITGINVREKVKAFEYVNKQPKLIIKTQPTIMCESNKKLPVHSAKTQISSPKKLNSKSPKNVKKFDDKLKEDSITTLQSSFFNSATSFFMAERDNPNSAANLLINHQKSRGLAAAILSSSLNTSSQFISPPLPGHIAVDDYKRDKSNDHDLKRGINVNSLILNTSNMEESLPSTPSSKVDEANTVKRLKKSSQEKANCKNKNSNSSNEMIIISNAVKYEPKKNLNLNTAQNTNFNFKASSESLTSDSSTLFMSNNAPKSNKLKTMTDVLKAVDGDIIFGCNYTNQEANVKSPYKKYDLERDLSEITTKNTSHCDSFKSNKKISLSIDSLLNRRNEVKVNSPSRHSTENQNEKEKNSHRHQSQNLVVNNRNIMVDGLKRNINCQLEDVNKKDLQSTTQNNNSSRDKAGITFENENSKDKEIKQKLLKNERYNYLSPLKNMLKSKNQKIQILDNNDETIKSTKTNAAKPMEVKSNTNHNLQRKKYRTQKKHENKTDTESDSENNNQVNKISKINTEKNSNHEDPSRKTRLTKAKIKKDSNSNESSKEVLGVDPSKSKTLKTTIKKSCSNHKKSFNTIAKSSKIDNPDHLSIKSKTKTRRRIHVSSRISTIQPSIKVKSTRDTSIHHRRSRNKKAIPIKLPTETIQSKVSKYLNNSNNSRSYSRENLNTDKDIIDLSSSSTSSFGTTKKSQEKTIKYKRINKNDLEVSQNNSNFDGTFNVQSIISLNKSSNNTVTNKLDAKTKKKLIINAIEKSKTLKAPNVKAPTLISPTSTSTPQHASNASLSVVRTLRKTHQDNDSILNTSNASFLNNSRNISINNNTTITFSKGHGYKIIEPPTHPPPPPPLHSQHFRKNDASYKGEEELNTSCMRNKTTSSNMTEFKKQAQTTSPKTHFNQDKTMKRISTPTFGGLKKSLQSENNFSEKSRTQVGKIERSRENEEKVCFTSRTHRFVPKANDETFHVEDLSLSLTHLNNSQNFELLGSTLSLSNNRTKPKTSKEILQEISRLTNGTTPNLKPSDLDTSFSSNPSRTINNQFFSPFNTKFIHKK